MTKKTELEGWFDVIRKTPPMPITQHPPRLNEADMAYAGELLSQAPLTNYEPDIQLVIDALKLTIAFMEGRGWNRHHVETLKFELREVEKIQKRG